MNYLIHVLVTGAAIMMAAWIAPGVAVRNYFTAILFAMVLGFLHTYVEPVIQFVSFPITFFTFGLFSFVINVLMIFLSSWLLKLVKVQALQISNIFAGGFFAIILAVISVIFNKVLHWFI